MMMCKDGEGSKSCDAYVRIVTGAPYPMMMLAFDWTLEDVRFCTPVTRFSILGVDPTFNLGAFDVTVTTYRHLLLTVPPHTSKHPVMIGPLFIHVKKDFSAYHFFASSLVSKCPELAGVRCYETDGEAALVNAFSAVFNQAIHLRYFLHFRENIDRKLQQFNVPASVLKEYKNMVALECTYFCQYSTTRCLLILILIPILLFPFSFSFVFSFPFSFSFSFLFSFPFSFSFVFSCLMLFYSDFSFSF